MEILIEFDYDATESDELTLKKGDRVINAKFYEDGWYEGTLNGKTGVFPSNYGKQVQTESNKSDEKKSRDSSDSGIIEEKKEAILDEPKNPIKKVMGVGFGNIFQGKQIQLKRVNDTKLSEMDRKSDIISDKSFVDGPTSKVEQVRITVAYEPTNSEHLKLQEGDVVMVLDKKTAEDGFWRGKVNGKVGLFPYNLSVPYLPEESAKTSRLQVSNKAGPPLPLTAKPLKPKTTPAPLRPQSHDSLGIIIKSAQKNDDVEPEEIGFDSPVVHKPLVSHTADRARRTNIRLPKKVASLNDDANEKDSIKDKSQTLPLKDLTTDVQSADKVADKVNGSVQKTTVANEKMVANLASDSNDNNESAVNKDNRNGNLSRDSVTAKGNANSGLDTGNTGSGVVVRSASVISQLPASKSNLRPKSQMVNTTFAKEKDEPKSQRVTDSDAISKKLLILEAKISKIEEDNVSLRREMDAMAAKNHDHITDLSNTVKRLSTELTEEKRHRSAADEQLSLLKETVALLDQS